MNLRRKNAKNYESWVYNELTQIALVCRYTTTSLNAKSLKILMILLELDIMGIF